MELIEKLILEEARNKNSIEVFNGTTFNRSAILLNDCRGKIFEVTPTHEGEELKPVCSSVKFFKQLRYLPPSNYNYLMLTYPDDYNKFIICDMSKDNIREAVMSSHNFKPIERLIHYMLGKGVGSIIINKDGVFSSVDDGKTYDRNSELETFTNPETQKSILGYVRKFQGSTLGKSDVSEYQISVLGVKVNLTRWKTLTDSVINVSVERPIDKNMVNFEPLFQQDKGIVILNRNLLKHLPYLLQTTSYRKVAFKGLGILNIIEDNLMCSYFDDTIDNKELRALKYDVHVIDVEYFQNPELLLNLPGALNILITDLDSLSKCINSIKSLPNSKFVVKNLLIDNLLGIVMQEGKNKNIILDDWSRELLSHESDLDRIMQKLEEPFIIRDGIDTSDRVNINIREEIINMFKFAKAINAYNIDICPGSEIRLYYDKTNFKPYSKIKLTPTLVEVMVLNMLTPKEIDTLYTEKQIDTSYSLGGVGRYRLSIGTQRSSLTMSIRKVPDYIPSPEELRLPTDFVNEVASKDKGLTLIVGEPGSGKTVTFNSIIDKINSDIGGIIFLMGSPIEYTHNHKKGMVIQVEVGKDIGSYKDGIARAYRSHTSVLGFEELRTTQEFSMLGALLNSPNKVFLTMHGPSCRVSIESIIQNLHETGISERKAREDVANALNYVMFQKLVDYNGQKILIYEKLKATDVVKSLIKEGNFSHIQNALLSEEGCESLDKVIYRRLQDGLVDFSTVKNLVSDMRFFESKGYKP